MKKTLLLIPAILVLTFSTKAQTTCATAVTITAGLHTEDTLLGTDIPDPVCAQNGAGADNAEWYSYTPSDDFTINLSTDLANNSGLDTRFHVYSGSCGALTCIAGDDDSGSGFLSYASFTVLSGNTYYIAFDDRWDASGFDFTLEEHPYVAPTTPPITFSPSQLPNSTTGAAYAVVDMNGDFLDDAITVDEGMVQIHYQNSGGGYNFSIINHDTVEFMPTWSMAVGDFDGNGYNDMLYGNGVGVTFMKSNSNGTDYQEVSGSEYVFSQRSNFIDINNDGHLDAFVCHDVDPNVYYINDGNGNLQYVQGGIGDHPQGGNYGSIWTDYDNDGDQDLFIAKCRGGQSTAKINELFRNDGGGVFTDVSIQSNMRDSVQTWSSAWNDYDNDGFMDALVGASSTTDGTHKLMYNNGDGTFSDITSGSGWDAHGQYSIEHVSYDFDNDGFTDVLGGGGEIMFNNGDLTFSPIDYSINNGPIGDLNNDGFLDVRVGSTVYYNDGNDNNWLKVNLQGVQSNLNGIGARVEIYGSWGKQIRDIRSGVGFRYMNSLNAHFGIGEATEIDSIMVKWPSGTEDVIYQPDTNSTILVVEGEHTLEIANNDLKALRIYPNPVKETLNIEGYLLNQASELYITDMQGKRVLTINEEVINVNVSSLPKGPYILNIKNDLGRHWKRRFIKQ